eukprot:117136-Rhodomonas_salina.2
MPSCPSSSPPPARAPAPAPSGRSRCTAQTPRPNRCRRPRSAPPPRLCRATPASGWSASQSTCPGFRSSSLTPVWQPRCCAGAGWLHLASSTAASLASARSLSSHLRALDTRPRWCSAGPGSGIADISAGHVQSAVRGGS